MGNSPPTGGLRPANGDHRSLADITQNFKIVFTGKEVETTAEKWRMVYNAGKEECVYILSKTKDSILLTPPRTQPHPKMLEINIHDKLNGSTNSIFINIYREQTGLLHVTTRPIIYHNKVFNFYNTTRNAYGGTTDSIYTIYGTAAGRRRGLVIMEWKRKDKDEFPYTGNVMHYYVNGEDGEDVGFYVAIKRIRQSRDGNDFEFGMDGPEQHPAHALAYMIDEVLRTGGTWKPTYCPHCANKYIDERQSDMQSETESDRDNVPAAPPMLHGRPRNNNAGTIVSNPGRFKGKDIGNTYIKHFNFGRKKW